jgi:hypothetical protein
MRRAYLSSRLCDRQARAGGAGPRHRQTRTIVTIVTHNAAIAGMADRVVRMSSGAIAEIQRNASRISPSELAW